MRAVREGRCRMITQIAVGLVIVIAALIAFLAVLLWAFFGLAVLVSWLRFRRQARSFGHSREPFSADAETCDLSIQEWAQLHLTIACWDEKAREPRRYPSGRKAGLR